MNIIHSSFNYKNMLMRMSDELMRIEERGSWRGMKTRMKWIWMWLRLTLACLVYYSLSVCFGSESSFDAVQFRSHCFALFLQSYVQLLIVACAVHMQTTTTQNDNNWKWTLLKLLPITVDGVGVCHTTNTFFVVLLFCNGTKTMPDERILISNQLVVQEINFNFIIIKIVLTCTFLVSISFIFFIINLWMLNEKFEMLKCKVK